MFYSPISQEFRILLRYLRPWRTSVINHDIESSVKFGKEKFLACLNVEQFKPEDISVKVTDDNTVTIEGKHEEKQEGNGYIARHFVRKYVLPKGHDMNKLESKLSSDGILSISASRITEIPDDRYRTIPIMKTGKPHNDKEN